MRLEQADKLKLVPLLDKLSKAIEDLLQTGLTTASEATQKTLQVSFQEASRMGLLRLGSTLRVACEELSRYSSNHAEFTPQRFVFFLNRAWLLTNGILLSIKQENNDEFERLTWTPPAKPVGKLEVVVIGVSKKVVAGTFCAFEFRLRSLGNADGGITTGQPLIWSSVFPLKPGQDVPAEAFLHLPQKQKFNAFHFLEGKRMIIENASILQDKENVARLSFGEKTTVTQGPKFTDWIQFANWDIGAALARLKRYEAGPLDLEIELQEEVFLDRWELCYPKGARISNDSQIVLPVSYPIGARKPGEVIFPDTDPIYMNGVQLDVVLTRGDDGASLRNAFKSFVQNKTRPGLFGLMHYEKSRLVFQPLSRLDKDGPQFLTLSKDKVDRVALLKVLKF